MDGIDMTAREPDPIAMVAPSITVKFAAGLTAVAGLITACTGAQLLGVTFYATWANLVPYAQLSIGVIALFTAMRVYRMHHWAALAATSLGGVGCVAMTGWFMYSFETGLFTCFAVMAPALWACSTVFAALSISTCRRATEARRVLQEQGIELGF